MQCHGITNTGTRCQRTITDSSNYCWQHQNQATDRGEIMDIEDYLEIGDLKTIQYLIEEEKISLDNRQFQLAIRNGHLNIVKYLVQQGTTPVEDDLALAIEYGNLDMVKYFVSLGMQLPHDSMELAIAFNDLNMIKYLISQGIKATAEQINEVKETSTPKIAKYLEEHQ